MTIHHVITINIGSTPETKKFLKLLEDYLTQSDQIQKIIDKVEAITEDVKSTIE